MDFEELVNTRKSVRGFRNQPVPRAASFPANAVKSDREQNNDFVRYVGFAD